ncbi:hypothetical protein LFYK43_10830 [Ligilactobacillus salitolerans]|uniref:DnaB/C C-terminal domain-containing protein n=1 Tax=Ligilactobacillus salitolerans TaxID=1808352 RepID=A0A401ISX4_9LACO|nr:DnaD domain protein [Ligilactobacillus salitolerans]GBG94624.1 hypothetical protein LFYK43_10830 [Ligilactobacillus salitolerans]
MTVRKVTKQDRKFQGVWIPAKYWLDEDLKIVEVVFLTEINSLDNDQGCFASNKYFSEFFGLTAGRCSQVINGLVDKGYLSVEYDREGKQIKKRTLRVVNKLNTPIKNIKGGYLENAEGNNTSINNTEREGSSSKEPSNIFVEYQLTGATLSNNQMLILMDYEQRLGDELILHAISYMDDYATKPNFNYLRKILNAYETKNVTTVEKAEEIEKAWVEKNEAKSKNYQRPAKPKHHSIKDTWDKEHERKEKLKQEYLAKYGEVPVNLDTLMDRPNIKPMFKADEEKEMAELGISEDDMPW